jgi:hypothetical protein
VLVFLSAIGLLAVSAAIGHGLAALCGWRGFQGWAPAAGLALLVVLGGQAVRGTAWVTPLAVAGLVLAVLALLVPGARRALLATRAGDLWAPLVTLALASLPFAIAGHTGVLGPGVSDDLSAHLLAADWLRTHAGVPPAAALGQPILQSGYPVGPHGLVAGMRGLFGLGEEQGFDVLLILLPALTTMAAQSVLPAVRSRGVAAVLAGLGYLPAAYLAQSAFKETLVALLLLAAVAVLDGARETRGRDLALRLAPLGVLAAAAGYVYGIAGPAWPVGAALLCAAVTLVAGPRRLRRLGELALAAVPPTLVLAVLLAPDRYRLSTFAHSKLDTGPAAGRGNLVNALDPLEAAGVWLTSEFRLVPAPRWPSLALGVLAVAALLAGLRWWWRERRPAPPAGLAAALVLWAVLALTRNPYAAAKGLVVAAPMVVVVLAAPLLATRRGRLRVPARAVAVVLAVAAAVSSFLVLRTAQVGLGPQTVELSTLRGMVDRGPVLFLGTDHYAQWALRGTDLTSAPALYAPRKLYPAGAHVPPYALVDFPEAELDRFTWVIGPAAAYRGSVPPNFRLVRRTPSYRVYRRRGPTPRRGTIAIPGRPGDVLDCRSATGRAAVARSRAAGVLPTPKIIPTAAWRGQPERPGETAHVTFRLPAGRWDVSLQYLSHLPLQITAPGLDAPLPRRPEGIGAYTTAGTLVSRGGMVTVSVRAADTTGLAKLLGARPTSLVARTANHVPLHHLVLTRHGARPRVVAIARACGRWVDWLVPR